MALEFGFSEEPDLSVGFGERFGDVLAALAEAVDGLSAMLRAHGES